MPVLNRVTLENPADIGSTFVWPLNPAWDAESKAGNGYQQKQIQIERTSNTGNVGATKQQGDDGPFIYHWEFPIYDENFAFALWSWYTVSKKQSIYMTDFGGDKSEGQIITCEMARQGVQGGSVGGASAGTLQNLGYYYNVVFEFEVWRFISGLLADAGVTA